MKPIYNRFLIYSFILILFSMVLGCSSPEDKKQAFLEKGNQLFEQKEFVKARLEYKNAIQIDPDFGAAYYRLGKTELEMKNYKQAYGMLSKSLTLDPDNIDARLILGKLLLAGKAPDQAMAQAQTILEKEPENVEGRILLASTYFVKKEYAKGEKILLDLYDSGNTSADMYVMLSSMAKLHQDKVEMKKYLAEGLEKNPDHIPLILSMAQLDAADKQFDSVVTGLQKVINLKPDSIVYRLNLAKTLLVQGKKAEAEAALKKALKENEEDEKTRVGIASFWLSAKEVQKAEDVINDGLKISKDSFTYRLFLAELYAKTKRIDESEKILRESLELNPDPSHPEIIKTKVALAKILLIQAKVTEGESLIDQVLENDPKNVDAHFVKGKLYLSRNDGTNAVPEFRLVVEDRPQMLQGHLNLAQAHVLNKDNELAMEVLQKAYKNNPDSGVFLKAMARLNMMQNNMDAAEGNLIAAEKIDKNNLQPVIDLGDFYLAAKRYEKAIEKYQIIIDKKPTIANGYLKVAAAYSAQKKMEKSFMALEAGYKNNPDSALILSNLIKLYIAQKDFSPAIKLCNDRLDKNGDEAFTWNLLGGIYIAQKDIQKAKKALEKAIEFQPDWGKPYENLARIYLASGEKQSAIQKFDAALDKDPKNRAAWMILGSIYEKDKSYEKAALTYDKAFENNPGLWMAANNSAFIKSELSTSEPELQKAMELARKADMLKPNAGVVLDTLGWIQFKMGNIEDAYLNIKMAIDQHPDNSILNYHMAMVLDRQGKEKEAKLYLEKSLASDSEFLGIDTARKILAKYNSGQ